MAGASGRASLRAGERRHSPFIRQRRKKALPARIRGKSQLSIAREGFLDRRSKRCFWLLLSPQTKVARAGARNYPRRRQIMRLRRCAATPHPPPSGAPSPQGEGLEGAPLSNTDPSRGRLEGAPLEGRALGDGGRSETRLPWLGQVVASASAPVNASTVLLSDNGDKRLCPREYAGNHN